jgi:hypothetical protein
MQSTNAAADAGVGHIATSGSSATAVRPTRISPGTSWSSATSTDPEPTRSDDQPCGQQIDAGYIPNPKEDNMDTNEEIMSSSRHEYAGALLRHFADLQDGTHGGATSRRDKERLFTAAVALLDPHARQALDEINTELLLHTGGITATGVGRSATGVLAAVWALSWPEQRAARIKPIVIRAYFGIGSPHPHLQGGTVGDWPLNVFDQEQAAAELPTLRTIASGEIHNLVFQTGGDYRIIPALLNRQTR